MSRNRVGVTGNDSLVMGLTGLLLTQFIAFATDLQIMPLDFQLLGLGTGVQQQAEWQAPHPEAHTVEDLENKKKQLEQIEQLAEELGDGIEEAIKLPIESAEKQRASTAHPEVAKLEQKQADEMEKLRDNLDGRRRALEEKYADAPKEIRDGHLDNFNIEAAKQVDAKAAQHREERDNLQAELTLSEPEQRDLWKRSDLDEPDRNR